MGLVKSLVWLIISLVGFDLVIFSKYKILFRRFFGLWLVGDGLGSSIFVVGIRRGRGSRCVRVSSRISM